MTLKSINPKISRESFTRPTTVLTNIIFSKRMDCSLLIIFRFCGSPPLFSYAIMLANRNVPTTWFINIKKNRVILAEGLPYKYSWRLSNLVFAEILKIVNWPKYPSNEIFILSYRLDRNCQDYSNLISFIEFKKDYKIHFSLRLTGLKKCRINNFEPKNCCQVNSFRPFITKFTAKNPPKTGPKCRQIL